MRIDNAQLTMQARHQYEEKITQTYSFSMQLALTQLDGGQSGQPSRLIVDEDSLNEEHALDLQSQPSFRVKSKSCCKF